MRLRIRRDIRRANAWTASITPVPGETAQNAPETTRSPVRVRRRADASQKPYRARAVRRRVWWRAHRPAYQPTPRYAPSASRQTAPRTRHKPPEARSAPEARQTPARSLTARAPSAGAYGGARTDRRTSPHRVTRQALRARSRPDRGCGKSRKRQIAEAANRGSGKSRKRQIADPSEHNQKTNGNRYSVTTTKGFNNTRQIAY